MNISKLDFDFYFFLTAKTGYVSALYSVIYDQLLNLKIIPNSELPTVSRGALKASGFLNGALVPHVSHQHNEPMMIEMKCGSVKTLNPSKMPQQSGLLCYYAFILQGLVFIFQVCTALLAASSSVIDD